MSASAAVSVPVIDDRDIEGDETFTVRLTGTSRGELGTATTATATITNNDPTPYVVTATTNQLGDKIELAFAEAITNTAMVTDFTVSGAASNPAVSGFSLNAAATILTLELSGIILSGESITLAYNKGSGSISNADGRALASFTGQAVTVLTSLPLHVHQSGFKATVANEIELTFAGFIAIENARPADFTVIRTPSTSNPVVTALRKLDPDIGGDKLILTLSKNIVQGDVLTLSYTRTQGGILGTTPAGLLANFSGQAVVNEVPADTSAPAAPTITPPTATSVTEASLTLSGTAEAGASIQLLRADTEIPGATTTADANGDWSITFDLTEGENLITATASDAAGNVSVASDAVSITLDTIAPAAPTITPPTATSVTEASFTISGSAEAGASIQLLRADTEIPGATTTADANEDWSITFDLTEGDNVITATASDATGNVSVASAAVSITLDTTAPIITLTGDNPQIIEQGAGYIELDASTDDGSEVSIDSSAFMDAVGTYIITYTATDGTNQAIAVTRTVNVVDTTAPAKPVITPPTDDLVTEASLTLSGSAEVGASIQLLRGGTAITSATTDADTNGDWSITFDLTEGDNVITATASDAAGNPSAASDALTITLDTTAPAKPVITAPTDDLVTEESLTLSGSAEAGASIQLLRGGVAITSASIVADTNGDWSITFDLTEGDNVITATATDATSNTSLASAPVSITLDTVAPTITLTGEASPSITKGNTYTDAGATASDNIDGDITSSITSTIAFNGNTVAAVDANIVGVYTITYNVSDAAGNAATAVTRVVTVMPPGAFMTTWRTTMPDQLIRIPIVGTNYTVNWGDGSSDTTESSTKRVEHTYAVAGTYSVSISGTFSRVVFGGIGNAVSAGCNRLIAIDQWGAGRQWGSMEKAFIRLCESCRAGNRRA